MGSEKIAYVGLGWIVAGTLLFAAGTIVGGLMTTYGWSERSSARTRRALAEEREKDINSRKGMLIKTMAGYVGGAMLAAGDTRFTEPNDAKLTEFVVFPRFDTTGLSAFISSGLFVGSEEDFKLYVLVLDLCEHLTVVNRRLDLTEDLMTRDPKSVPVYRKSLRDGTLLSDARTKAVGLFRLLVSEYGIPGKALLDLIGVGASTPTEANKPK